MMLLFYMVQYCLGTSQLVPATSQISQYFFGANQGIVLLIKKTEIKVERLVSMTPHASQGNLRKICYDYASPHVS